MEKSLGIREYFLKLGSILEEISRDIWRIMRHLENRWGLRGEVMGASGRESLRHLERESLEHGESFKHLEKSLEVSGSDTSSLDRKRGREQL
jgi:hypothetical protein